MPQVVQFPMQQTIPVQVPISTANGQTLYQTIHFPVQAFATAIPNIIQASGSQMQMIPQLSQVCVLKCHSQISCGLYVRNIYYIVVLNSDSVFFDCTVKYWHQVVSR
jgi:hypothetical protein